MIRPTRPLRLLRLGASAAAAVVALLALAMVVYVREQSRREHTDAIQDHAHAVSLSLDAWVGTIDYVLQVSADEIEHQASGHGVDAAAINRFLARQQSRFPHIDLLRAANAQGEAVWGSGVDAAQRASLAQRDYYKRLRDDPALGMVIAEPIVGRISQQWIWLMARRINAPDGSFAGLVYASMFIRDLTRMLQHGNPPAGGLIVLRDARNRIVASTAAQTPPAGASAPTEAEERHLAELAAALRAEPVAGSFTGHAPNAGGAPTLYAYRRNPVHGYTLLVGQPLAAADAQWQPLAGVLLGLLAASVAGLVYFVKATARGWEQEVLAETLALREREHGLLKSLIRTIPDLVWLKSTQGAYLACNAEFERFLGRREADLVGKSDLDLLDSETAESFRAHDRLALAAGRPTVNEEWITYASDGRRALLKTTKAPLHAPDGALTGVLGVGHDITEQRRTEDALREHEDQLSLANAALEQRVIDRTAELQSVNRQLIDTQIAMEGVGIGITWVDFESGRFIWANRYAAEVLGYARDEMLGMTVSDIDPHFPPEAYAAAKPSFVTEGHRRFETGHRTRDGRMIPVEMTVYYDHRDLSVKPRLIAFSSSIAARKEAERALLEAKAAAEAASRAKSAFLANMSHEIRTPLNALLGLSHLLRNDPLSPTQTARLDKMVGAGRHLLSIISDILDLSKVEAGRLQIETANFHLSAVLDNVASLVSDAAAAKGLALEVDPDGVPLWLCGDATRLRQALLNFAGNAVKFTDRGRVALRALLVADRGDDLVVRFEVQDSGPGLSEAQCARLFQPFEQVDGSAARRHGGTGLGLALNKGLIELMQGSIGVDSVVGQGSTFWFEVPLRRGHGPVPEAAVPELPLTADERLRLRHTGARVLLAEDNAINIEVVQELMHAVGLDVVVADNGRAAVEAAENAAFDLMLMDMQMPEMDGIEATRRIRLMAHQAATPILALTANAVTESRQACLDVGMDAVLTKPVDPVLLYESLLHWLDQGAVRKAAHEVRADDRFEAHPGWASGVDALRGLDGLDFDGALARLRGKADRLVALLRLFARQHLPDPALLREELESGNLDAAGRRMHRLKGAASQLGLVALAADAHGIEEALRADPSLGAGTAAMSDAAARMEAALLALQRVLESKGLG
ncbi:putative Histidine kinase [Rubrivivax sp. A210]|uniref:PAS domain S-box protein n=1 Tax=Rubrivivax sp. A210 TaxID=2772301 RepID=UPI00191AB989|nr:PAS domain S-box protein [Rubrivivax sp. A210]CAD5374901.1 putative Histidine kinase [Rubrivivax sp. A210]